MVKIRLRRMGAKKRPFYRLVVAEARSPRDGRFIDQLGIYDPLTEPAPATNGSRAVTTTVAVDVDLVPLPRQAAVTTAGNDRWPLAQNTGLGSGA